MDRTQPILTIKSMGRSIFYLSLVILLTFLFAWQYPGLLGRKSEDQPPSSEPGDTSLPSTREYLEGPGRIGTSDLASSETISELPSELYFLVPSGAVDELLSRTTYSDGTTGYEISLHLPSTVQSAMMRYHMAIAGAGWRTVFASYDDNHGLIDLENDLFRARVDLEMVSSESVRIDINLFNRLE